MTGVAPALALEHIGKRFGDVEALHDATLTVYPGTVHALLGENGAGKSTLMKIAYGMESPQRGVVRLHGHPVRFTSPANAIAAGVGMVHQHFTLVPAMTVAENIALGEHGRFDAKSTATRVQRLADANGFHVDPNALVRNLEVSGQQRIELLKVLARDARILIFDEPTAVLAPTEASDFLVRIRQLADSGRAIVLITHKLREALSVADEVTVLRRGVTTLSSSRRDVNENQLVEAMLGQREISTTKTRVGTSPRSVVISARDVEIADMHGSTRIRGATFVVRSGEIMGVAAVEGSGHRELLRAIARRLPICAGKLDLPTTVGFVPDDRHRDGLILEMSLTENFALKGAGDRHGFIAWRQMATATRQVIHEFDVRAEGEGTLIGTLSGGNQQKFILGRELHDLPPALVAENPTRGLDVRASAYVRDRLILARASGVAVIVHSADLDEVLSVADRMLVVYSGAVQEVAVDADVVGRAMLGAA